MNLKTSLHKTLGVTLGLAVVLFVGIAAYLGSQKAPTPAASADSSSAAVADQSQPVSDQTAPTTPAVSVAPAVPPKKVAPASAYKNGTYSANGSYMSPGGQDEIAVTVTLANGVITDASVSTVVADRTSQRYQNAFISGYKQYVIGQNIANVNLTRVSGSSLTPEGFDAALAQIKAQAKA